nr:translocation/assembly module TamB domain-containing protein [Alcanivorax sp. S6407]
MLVGLLAYILVGTAAGNRWVLDQARGMIPGELQVESWQGNLLGNLSLSGIHYRNDSLSLDLEQLDANLHPLTLSRGWLTFEYLRLGQLNIHTHNSETGQSQATLPDSLALPLGIRIEQLAVASVTLNDTPIVKDLQGESLAAWRRFQLARLEATALDDLQLHLSGHGQLSRPYPLDGHLRWQKPLPASDQLSASQASGELYAHGTLTALQLSHDLHSPLNIHSNGQWHQADQQSLIDLSHQWQAQPLPLRDDPGLSLEAGTLITRGPLADLQLEGSTSLTRVLAGQPSQTLDVMLDGSLADQTLTLTDLTLRQSAQRLTAKGMVRLQPLQWDLAINGDLDPGMLLPTLPGKLVINGHSKGRIDGNHWQLEPGTLTISGELRQQPLNLQAQTRGDANNLQIDSHLQWGNNRVQLAGKAWPQWQLSGSLALNTISQLEPSLQGSITGRVRLAGQPASPRVSGQLNGTGLGWEDITLDQLQTEFSDLGIGPQSQQLSLSAGTLQQAGRVLLDSMQLNVNGKLNQHQLTLGLQQGGISLDTELDGAMSLAGAQPPLWQGKLHDTRISQPHLGQWHQQVPSSLSLSPDRQQLGELCLTQQQSQLCAEGDLQGNHRFALEARADAIPLALLSALIGQDYSLEGILQGRASLAGNPQAPSGSVSLNTRDARLSFNVQDGPAPWQLDTLSLESELDGQQAHSRFVLATALGKVNADVKHGFTLDSAMQGQASFRVERLSAVEMLTADLRDVSGTLNGDIQLGGSPREPLIEGAVNLRDGNALIPALGSSISDMNLTLQGSPQGRLAVDGQARMGIGTLKVSGYLDPGDWPPALRLHFSGQQLLVADRPDARVWVSPDLTLAGDLQGLMLSGQLQIPQADIHPEQLPEGAITVSEDQVLVHEQADAGQQLPLGMNVTVILGDKVNFNGFGLNAKLGGKLQILQEPHQPPQLNGELIVLEGRYRAYGQNLAISDGQLIFQGPPDNPGLDIRAYRKIPSEAITVGVQLGGTLQSPEATLYSEPAMEPSQIMSYLLTGRPLEGGTQSDANRIAQALAVYGLEKGSGVTEKIGDKLGVDEITVGSDWETEDAALMLGKQLSDRLYLTYAIGLFDAVSTVMLRYTLTRSLHLEARSSSEANSLDLIWEKELR